MKFCNLKHYLISPPVLSYFSANLPLVLTCDASDKALGTCLAHVIDGIEKPIAHISRALTPTESRYSTTEKKGLACLRACER